MKMNVTKKSILETELMKEIIGIRIDSLWKMLSIPSEQQPDIYEEGATGKFDNKGAIFCPGGYIPYNSQRRKIKKEKLEFTKLESSIFVDKIRDAMKYDNAILFYEDGISKNVNLDNGFFLQIAPLLLRTVKHSRQNKRDMRTNGYRDLNAMDINKSYFPPVSKNQEEPRYGSRSLLTSSIATCMNFPSVYCDLSESVLNLYEEQSVELFDNIRNNRKPIYSGDEKLLANSHLIICHDTKYLKNSMVGLTRIMTENGFGEFATFSIEKVTNSLFKEFSNKKKLNDDEIIANYFGSSYVGVLRKYPGVSIPGRRSRRVSTSLIKPRELGIDLESITYDAIERYNVNI